MTATATKTLPKNWIRAASNFIELNPSRLVRQMLAILFLSWIPAKGLYQSSGKEIGSCCMVFPSSTKRKIKHFHDVVVQRRLGNVQKSVMHGQSVCFVNLKLLLFYISRSRRHRRWLWFWIAFLGRNDLTDSQREFSVDNIICVVRIGFEKRGTNTK